MLLPNRCFIVTWSDWSTVFHHSAFKGSFIVMSSSGGTLTPPVARRLPVRVVESGPAAGAQMSVFHGRALELPDLLSFDMGGTTAKGALVRGGAAMKVYELEVARQHEFMAGSGMPVRTPVIDMIEIGAGGGQHRRGGLPGHHQSWAK